MHLKAKVKRLRDRDPRRKRPPPEGMSLAELAAQVGATPRAVRHYFESGVLAPPEFRGSRTRYGREYLVRLFAIRALLKDGLDLEDIRRRLDALTPAELEAYLPPPPPPASTNDALAAFANSTTLAPDSSTSVNAPWQRVALLPGLELHLRVDASPAVRTIAQTFIHQCLGTVREPLDRP